MKQQTQDTVSIVGLGKLGSCMAAAMADRGLNVIGVDVNGQTIRRLNDGLAPVREPSLDEMVAKNRARLRATASFDEAVSESCATFVVVPTPSDERGAFSLQFAARSFESIGAALKKKNGDHLVVLTSTVLPGSTRHGLLPLLEKHSGRRCGEDFGLCYNPEFIALGSVIRDFLNPDFHLVGEFDKASGDRLEAINSRVCLNGAPFRRMSIENAELAKIALNSYVTLKISFANMLADLCERIPGGNVDVVSDALGFDSRIGRKYLTGGLGFGGPCFPRDGVALNFLGEAIGADCGLIRENDAYNRRLPARVIGRLLPLLDPQGSVAVLGLAYKPHSEVIEESPGIALARALAEAGRQVTAYDPLANNASRAALQGRAGVVDSLADCIRDATTVIVATPDSAFRALGTDDLLGAKSRVTVVDFWRTLAPAVRTHPAIRYIPIGHDVDTAATDQALRTLWTTPTKS
jgi:UDPglucose 6-dehydrogenase